MTCAPVWAWYAITGALLLVVILQLVSIVRSQTPARHAAEAAYELREQKAWLARLYGVPADTTSSDFAAFVRQRHSGGNGAIG